MLHRLARETGGRLTHATNDFSLGFARAQRDLGCQYAIGFYLQRDAADRPRRIAVHARGNGLRVLHPSQYKFRSESDKRTSTLTAAFFAPEMFQTDYLRVHVFPLHPVSAKSWETLLAVSFPVNFENPDRTFSVDFGGVVRQGSRAVHSFHRRVTLRPFEGSSLGERRFTFLEPAYLEPGEYEVVVVSADAGAVDRPASLKVAVEVPPIPRKEMMLVPPILGRPRDENIVVRGTAAGEGRSLSPELAALLDVVATKGSFEPLLVQLTDDVDELLARNKACIVSTRKNIPETSIERTVLEGDETAVRLQPVPLDLHGGKQVMCQNVFEVLPENAIDPGQYRFEASVENTPKHDPVLESIRFAVDDPAR